MARTAGENAPQGAWALLEELPALACALDAAGALVFANARWRERFGASPAVFDVARRDQRVLVHDASGSPGWYDLSIGPARGPGVAHFLCIATAADEAQRYDRYLGLLVEAGNAFEHAADVRSALESVGRLLVRDVVDWFVFYAADAAGSFAPVCVLHADERQAASAFAALRADPGVAALAARVASAGDTAPATSDDFGFGWTSTVLAPVAGRERSWGVLQLANDTASRRTLGAAERRLARELARRAGTAFENAALLESAERAADDLRFLAGVGETMLESLELEARLDRFVQAVVPRLADWATVNLLQDDGSLETVAIAHADPTLIEIVDRLRGRYNGNEDVDRGTPMTLRTGRSQLITGIDEATMNEHIRPESIEDVGRLGADSAFVVPLAAHGRIYGTLSAMRGRERPFVPRDMWLIEELARRAAVGIAHAKLFRHNANVADAFQQASLPGGLPAVSGVTFSAYYAPGRREATVGGDWYDAFALGDGRIVVSIGDVSGSGLAAAVIMGSVRQVIRGAAQLDADPRVILDATDRALRSEYPDIVVTAFVAVIQPDRTRLTYASAGHPPPLLRTPGGDIRELATVGLPLGLRERWEAPEEAQDLRPGALLIFYTDGLIESTRDLLQGQRSLLRALQDRRVVEAPNVARAIFEAVLPDGASDDVAILAARL